jgi:hypothetical protein
MKNNRRRFKGEKKVKKVVTRCSYLKRPVFEHEVCEEYIQKTKTESDNQKNCRNCKYSF